jgi:hypothetical protein
MLCISAYPDAARNVYRLRLDGQMIGYSRPQTVLCIISLLISWLHRRIYNNSPIVATSQLLETKA